MVDTSDEWIMQRVGIKERRILKGEGLGSSDMGEKAVRGLLEKTNTSPDDIDLLICCTVTPDMAFPATANIISDKPELKMLSALTLMQHVPFLSCRPALHIRDGRFESNHSRADKMSSITDYTDRPPSSVR
jgi:3-oxoacyl-[acyl-carrier-protein] synthase-3